MSTPLNPYVYLNEIPIFEPLSEDDTRLLSKRSVRRQFDRGAMIALESQPAEAFAVVYSGLAKAVLIREDGGEVLLHYYPPGSFFGELNIGGLPEIPHSVVAAQKCQLLVMPLSVIQPLVQKNADFAMTLLSHVCGRLAETQLRVRSLLSPSAEQRVLGYFAHLAAEIGEPTVDGQRIAPAMSHQMIADACGLARETVTRTIAKLRKSGELTKDEDGWILQ